VIEWKDLEKKGVRISYNRDIKDMYEGISTRVRTQDGDNDIFSHNNRIAPKFNIKPHFILDVCMEHI